MIVVLTGGTGGAKFAEGLREVLPPRKLTFVVNTGDDLRWWGLPVSPDLDSITYALAGLLSRQRGWGVEGDTFHCLEAMGRLGAPVWFQVGDRDLALHLTRSQLLAAGKTLSEAMEEIARDLGITARVLPMTNARVETRVVTRAGELSFEEYFVRERHQTTVQGVRFVGAARAEPAAGVLAAIDAAEAVLLAPSNPVTSLGPILAIPGVRAALIRTGATVGAISPIVGGAAVSGPAGSLMRTQGLPVSIEGVARAYAGFLDVLIVDHRDTSGIAAVERLGVRVHAAQTMMRSLDDKIELARVALAVTCRKPVPQAAVG
ncbi:MAG: 2-phospho-L-lactate transferase [Terriglobia bacterium]